MFAFESYVYIDLAAKTEMRNGSVQAAHEDIKKNGYRPNAVAPLAMVLEDVSLMKSDWYKE